MAFIRTILGALIQFFDRLFTPKSVQREDAVQAEIDAQTPDLLLYQYAACPFCVKVRRVMKRLALSIETRDAKRGTPGGEELMAGGGKQQVPCLRIQNPDGSQHWMYESSEIIHYLETRFPA